MSTRHRHILTVEWNLIGRGKSIPKCTVSTTALFKLYKVASIGRVSTKTKVISAGYMNNDESLHRGLTWLLGTNTSI